MTDSNMIARPNRQVADHIRTYLDCVVRALEAIEPESLARIVDTLLDAYREGRSVYTFGNGASASLADHMAADMAKTTSMDIGRGPNTLGEKRLRIASLTVNDATISAYANDVGYADVFVEQLKSWARPGDVFLGISGSGGSPNVLRALEYGRTLGAVTIALTGTMSSAAKMRGLCDICLAAPLDCLEQIEDVHVVFHHIITTALRDAIRDGAGLVVETVS